MAACIHEHRENSGMEIWNETMKFDWLALTNAELVQTED